MSRLAALTAALVRGSRLRVLEDELWCLERTMDDMRGEAPHLNREFKNAYESFCQRLRDEIAQLVSADPDPSPTGE
jgi:hypothetical protein